MDLASTPTQFRILDTALRNNTVSFEHFGLRCRKFCIPAGICPLFLCRVGMLQDYVGACAAVQVPPFFFPRVKKNLSQILHFLCCI